MFSKRAKIENRAWMGGVSFIIAAAMVLGSTVDVWALRTEAAGKTTTKTEMGMKLWEYGSPIREKENLAGMNTDVRIVEAYARKAAINLIGHQAIADEDLDKAVREYIEISGEKDLNPEILVKRLIVLKGFLNTALNNEKFLLRLFDEVAEKIPLPTAILLEIYFPDYLEMLKEGRKLEMARKIFIEDTRWPVLLLGKRANEVSLYSLGDPQSEAHKAVVAHNGTWAYEGSENISGGARSNYFTFARLEGYAKRGEEGLAAFQDEVIHEFKDWVRLGHKDEAPEIVARVNKINREIDKELRINGNQVYEEVRGGLGREPSVYGPHPMQEGLRPLYEKISWARSHATNPQFVIKNIYAFRDQKHGMAPVDAISFGIVLGDDTFIVQNAPVMGGLSAGGLEPETHPNIKAAIEFFNNNVSPRLKGLSVAHPDVITEMIIKIDEELNAQSEDKTLPRFSYIGAELAVGISMISTLALAEVLHVPAEVIINYRYNEYAMSHGLAKEPRPLSLPVDFSVVWEGGKHGVAKHLPDLVKEGIIKDDSRFPARFKDAELINKGDKSILLAMVPPQELQILCFAPDWDSAYDIGVKLTNIYQKLLKDNGIKTKYGAESGFTTEQVRTADGKLITLELVLGILEQAVSSLKPDEAKYVRYALDIAASEMYIPEIDMYYIGPDAAQKVDPANVDGLVTNEQFTQYKLMLFKAHPRFISCEDWAADDQITHWDPPAKLIMEKMIQMGDDLNVSRGDLILKHNALGIQNAHLHKPNQVSEERASMEAVATSHNLNNVVVWSHRGTRSPQETFTAQGAMGTGSLGSKFTLWGPGRSALIAVMSQANKMYRELGIKVLYQGAVVLDSNGPYKDYGWVKRLREEIGKEVEIAKIKTEHIKAEDAVYSVTGGEALDNFVEKVIEVAPKTQESPLLKVSAEQKKEGNLVQTIWQFSGVTIRKNFKLDFLAATNDVKAFVEKFNELTASVFEENNLALRKEAYDKCAIKLIALSEELSETTRDFVRTILLPKIEEELFNSKRIQKIEGEPRVFLVSSNLFKKGGVRNILRKVVELNKVANVKIALSGDKTREIQDILGIENENIITAKNLDELLKEFSNRNIESAKIIALIAPEDKDSDDSAKLKEAGIRQIVTPDMATLAMAKAIKELFSDFDFVRQAFNDFLSKILIEDKIILPINSFAHTEIIGELKEGVFVFSDQVELKPEITEAVQKVIDTETYKEFIKKFV